MICKHIVQGAQYEEDQNYKYAQFYCQTGRSSGSFMSSQISD